MPGLVQNENKSFRFDFWLFCTLTNFFHYFEIKVLELINHIRIKRYRRKGYYTSIIFSQNLNREEAWRYEVSDVEHCFKISKRYYSFVEAQTEALKFLKTIA